MTLKELLSKHKILKQSELARKMYEGKATPTTRLANKLSGVNYQRILPEDDNEAFKALKELSDDIIEYGETLPKTTSTK